MKCKKETEKEEKKEKEKKKKRLRNAKEQEIIEFPAHFIVVAADLSLRCPGFCVLEIKNGAVYRIETSFVNNKTAHKEHGEILNEIYQAMPIPYDSLIPVYYVREHMFNSRGAQSEIALFKVVGVMDLGLWRYDKMSWYEIYPVTVRKLVTGSTTSDKRKVAESLTQFIGTNEYTVDDESDAAAVAVAFLLQNGFVFHKESDANEQSKECN